MSERKQDKHASTAGQPRGLGSKNPKQGEEMIGAQAVVASLEAEGVDLVFGYPGGQVGKIGPVQRNGVHGARKRAGHIVRGAYVIRQHAPHRFRQGNALHQLALNLARMVSGSRAPTPAEALRLRVQRRQRCRDRFLARQLYMLRMIPHDRLFP